MFAVFSPHDQQKNMTKFPPSNLLRKQALDWLVRQQSGNFSRAERSEFERWLAQSPDHVEAFESLRKVWEDLPCPEPQLAVARRHYRSRRAALVRSAMAIAAVLLLVAGSIIRHEWPVITEAAYHTVKGEQRAFTLPDGSRIELATDSEVALHYGWTRRTLELKRGEALFDVAPSRIRPFEVIAGGARIRDIGTCFDVALGPQRNRVTVLEGAIELQLTGTGESRQTDAGQAMAYNAAAILSEPALADIGAAVAWRNGKLVFQATPLKQAMAELERYHPLKFIIADPALQRLPVSGVFESANIALFLTTLEAVFPLDARQASPHTIVLEKRLNGGRQ